MLVRHRTIHPFDRSIDRAFEQLTNSFYDTRRSASPVVDGAWDGDDFVLRVDLPGVPAEAVSVEAAGSTLTLGATTDSFEWKRSLKLGGRLDAGKIEARHVDGRLTVRVGTIDEPESRSISIDTTAPDIAIEATSTEQSPDGQSTETNDTE